jgi:hypothetical protein
MSGLICTSKSEGPRNSAKLKAYQFSFLSKPPLTMAKNSKHLAEIFGLLLALLVVLASLAGTNAQQSQEASTVIVTAPGTPQTATASESPTTSFGVSPTVRVAATATATALPDRVSCNASRLPNGLGRSAEVQG